MTAGLLRARSVRSTVTAVGLSVFLLASGVGAGPTAAHALLRSSDPAAGSTLGGAPAVVRLTFSETQDPRLTSVKVLDANGTDHVSGPLTALTDPPSSVSVPIDALPDGGYTVTWRAVSSVDGHISAGSFVFGVGVPAPTEAPAPAAGEVTVAGFTAAVVARFILYLGFLALFGAAWVAIGVSPRLVGGLLTLAAAGWILTAIGTAGVIGAQWAQAAAPIETIITTSLGTAALVRVISLALVSLALVGLAVVPSLAGPLGWAVVALAEGGVMVVDVILGHAGASATAPLQLVAQSAHAIGAAAWIGGLGALLLVLRSAAPEERLPTARRYSRWAGVMLLLVAATGGIRALDEVGTLDALIGTDFGRVALAKSGLFLGLALLGASNRYITLRTAERLARWLRRVGILEIGIATVVIALSALLVNLTPSTSAGPAASTPPSKPVIAIGHDFGTSVRARLEVTPGTTGVNTFDLTLTDYDSDSPLDAGAASLRFQVQSVAGVAATTLDLAEAAPGHFSGSGADLSIDGIWRVIATVTTTGSAVEVPLLLATSVPDEPVDEVVSEGLPTIYTVQLGAAGTAQVYFDPGRASDPGQLHVTFFDADGNERPIETATVAVSTAAGAGQLLAPRLLEPGHFVASLDADPGPLAVDVVSGTGTGSVAGHLHVHVTIEVQP